MLHTVAARGAVGLLAALLMLSTASGAVSPSEHETHHPRAPSEASGNSTAASDDPMARMPAPVAAKAHAAGSLPNAPRLGAAQSGSAETGPAAGSN